MEQTTSNVVNFRHVWTIRDFPNYRMEMQSPVFYDAALETVKWTSLARWKGKTEVKIKVQLYSRSSIVLKLTISTPGNSKDYGFIFAKYGVGVNYEIQLRSENFIEALPVTYDMIMFKDTLNYESSANFLSKLIGSNLEVDLSNLLDSQKFSDVTVHVNGNELGAHKSILASRSQVFAAMFEHDLKEKLTNRIDITDLGLEVVQEMLRFIYSGKSPNLHSMADTLLVAADKYALHDLRDVCLISLAQSLGNDTAVKILSLANLYQADALKGLAMDYITKNAAAILKTDNWQQLKDENPRLCIEIYEKQYKTESS